MPWIADTARDCGLLASTVKLTPPNLTTCEGARYNESSIQRCCEPVCMRGRVSVFVHVCVTVSEFVCVCVCVCVQMIKKSICDVVSACVRACA